MGTDSVNGGEDKRRRNQTLRPFEKPRRSGHPEIQTQRLCHPPAFFNDRRKHKGDNRAVAHPGYLPGPVFPPATSRCLLLNSCSSDGTQISCSISIFGFNFQVFVSLTQGFV